MEKTSPYGYFYPGNREGRISMKKGQNIAGYPVGIIYIDDVWYPMVPGNIVNGYTFDFPVRLMAVEGLTIDGLFNTHDQVAEMVLKTVKKLVSEGCRAISGACGFFGNYQKIVADALDVPVALSSLVQINFILPLLKSSQKLGVLTADQSSLSNKLLSACGVTDKSRLVIRDLRSEPEFSAILEGRGSFDNGKAEREVVEQALSCFEHDDIGAILLECSDMPPYAWAVQAACSVPVFDFTTLIRWLNNAVTQRPYCGFI
ncbi:hypothetical protein SDC9_132219 [bioreactor metagenome]|uniref:Uncharacterized protein n=1 Tax=bioreactor metagenome TaxID=1076179 RepID=A0A645D949_9ZZZZ